MKWTIEKLRALTVADRHEVWKKANSKGLHELVAMVEASGPFTETACLHADNPEYLEMHNVVFSDEAKQAAVTVTGSGSPAMAAVDPILQRLMGKRYGFRSMDTMVAGSMVADMMRSQGYKTTGRKGTLPADCLAKTAEIYVPAK
jgi:hypothetical protein